MRCGYCGCKLSSRQRICPNCGNRVYYDDEENGSEVKIEAAETVGAKRKSSYFGAVVMLLAVFAIVIVGCIKLLGFDLSWDTISALFNVSQSDALSPSDSTAPIETAATTAAPLIIDEALVGTWVCNDADAVGYDGDYGVEVEITLSFYSNGGVKIDYTLANAGIKARDVTIRGSWSAENGQLDLSLNLSSYSGDYFDELGSNFAVKYSISDDVLLIGDDFYAYR